jgi:Predicted hydrolases or acyltransferases (alpha/beta hydrolase superfamily)
VAADPSRQIASADGTALALFTGGDGPPLILVHGAAADHTSFRVVGPRLATWFTVHAMDRRGRGASGDTLPHSIEREFEDIAAVAETLAAEAGRPVAILGHSYGGRCALGAALLTDRIARVVCYEGAPAPSGSTYEPREIRDRLRAHLAAGDLDGLLADFMTEVVGMTEQELASYRADPIWPLRVTAARTIPRELDAQANAAASLDPLGSVRQPVLQLLGSESRAIFRDATHALDDRLADGRIVEMEGAKHAAHHTHPDVVVEAVRDFLG